MGSILGCSFLWVGIERINTWHLDSVTLLSASLVIVRRTGGLFVQNIAELLVLFDFRSLLNRCSPHKKSDPVSEWLCPPKKLYGLPQNYDFHYPPKKKTNMKVNKSTIWRCIYPIKHEWFSNVILLFRGVKEILQVPTGNFTGTMVIGGMAGRVMGSSSKSKEDDSRARETSNKNEAKLYPEKRSQDIYSNCRFLICLRYIVVFVDVTCFAMFDFGYNMS